MLYLFDVDGTLIWSFIRETGDADDYDRVELLPNRHVVIRRLATGGASFALVTNQAGVAMGYQTPEQVYAKMGRVISALDCFHGRPVSLHVCMHHPNPRIERWRQDPCPRRKPGKGMVTEAIAVHGLIPPPNDAVVMVGDMDSDRHAAQAAGVRYIDAAEFFD